MRLGDLVVLKEDFKSRLADCNEWIEKAKDKETKIRASAVKAFIGEVIMTIDNAPTVEAIPTELHEKILDKVEGDLFKVQEELNRMRNEKRQGEWLRKEDVIHHIAKQYSEHNEIVPIWLSIADMRGEAVGELLECQSNLRLQGEWIDYDNTFYKCPECGYLLEKDCPYCHNKIVLPRGDKNV